MSDAFVVDELSARHSSTHSNKQLLVIVAFVSFVIFVGSLIVCAMYTGSEARNYEETVAENSHCRDQLAAAVSRSGESSLKYGFDRVRHLVESQPTIVFIPGTGALGETLHEKSICSLPEVKPWYEYVPEDLALAVMGVSLTAALVSTNIWLDNHAAHK